MKDRNFFSQNIIPKQLIITFWQWDSSGYAQFHVNPKPFAMKFKKKCLKGYRIPHFMGHVSGMWALER